MKSQLLEKFEERFVFKISHYFFHALVAVAVLGLAIGAFMLLWGLTPSLKPGVDKAEYPPAAEVTAEELSALVLPAKKKQTTQPAAKSAEPEPAAGTPIKAVSAPVEASVDSAKVAYEQALDSLQKLIPPKKYSWKDRGHNERGWHRDRRGRNSYGEHWVVDFYGVTSRLKQAFRRANAQNYTQKAEILYSYLPIVARFEEKHRRRVIKALTMYSNDSPQVTLSNIALLEASAQVFGGEDPSPLEKLATFGKKNPRDGASFIRHANVVAPEFDGEYKGEVLDVLISAYYRHFNNRIAIQQRLSGSFLPFIPNYEGQYQAAALAKYYQLYLQKNQSREQAIAGIDNQYQRDLRQAEAVLEGKKAAKTENRMQGLMVVGGSIAIIAILALVLVLLSIQRQVKLIKAATVNEPVEEAVHY